MLVTYFRRFIGCQKANLSIIFAVSMVPLVFLVGMGVDYTSAAYRQEQLNAFADSAALAAVTPSMMAQGDAQSIAAAQNTFNAQATSVPGVSYDVAGVTVTVADSLTTRTVTVSYTAASQNAFPNVLGSSKIALSGQSQAIGSLAPNIDFYLLLDDSPSMAIAATPAGITTMVNNTPSQSGCAFGCHEINPSNDHLGNPGGEDNYALARNLGVTLRIDVLSQATRNLMTTAQTTEVTNHAAYRAAIYTFDVATNTIQTLSPDFATLAAQATTINVFTVYSQGMQTSQIANEADTNYDSGMNTLNGVMPNPGNGTNAKGDTPQEVLFFVTDGVEDETVGGGRQQSLMSPAQCAAVKARGIRIAVLYTTYLPLPTNAWYNKYIAPFQPNIAPTLETCASPGLYFQVASGGDISAALTALFQKAVQTSRLSE